MSSLKGFQRKYLKGLAHGLDPVVHLGKEGVSESLMRTVEESLLSHELIKLRFVDFKEDKKTLAVEIAEKAEAELIGMIGHIAIYFREHPDEDKRRVRVPSRSED